MEDPLKDVLIKSSKIRRKKKQPIPKVFDKFINSDYKEQYFPQLTDVFDKAVNEALTNKGEMFKLLISPSGGGKTSAVYRQAEALGYEVYRFDSSLSWNTEEVKDKMMNLAGITHDPPLVILLDDIDYNYLPVWLYPKKKIMGYDKDGKAIIKRAYNYQTFLQKAQKHSKKKNYVVIATCNEEWKIDYEFRKFFEDVKTKGAYPSRLKKVATEYGVELPEGFPRDLRQLHQLLQTGGLNTSYNRTDSSFAEVTNFLKNVPRGDLPDVKPPLETWVMTNTLNSDSTGMVQKHNIKFYDIIAVLCLADLYGDRNILRAFPKIGFLNQRKIRHPNTYYKELKKQRGL